MLCIIIVLLIVDIVIHLMMADSKKKDKARQTQENPPIRNNSQNSPKANTSSNIVPSVHSPSLDIDESTATETEEHQLTTLEEVKDTFTLNEFIVAYQSGEMARWLHKIGEVDKASRLREFNIPQDGTLSKEDKLKLCEVIFPNWMDLPGRIQREIDDNNYHHEDSYALTDEQLDQIWRALSKNSQSSLTVRKVGNDNDCLVLYNNHVCFVTSKELGKLLHENGQAEIGKAVNRFLASEPLCMSGRNLGYVIETLTEYIFNVARFYYDTNSRQITFMPEMSASIMFNDSQPMSNPHMVTIEHNSFNSKNDGDGEKKQLSPSYRFDKEQLESLIGISRIDIATKILGWLGEAHLIKTNRFND
jgi:hypothetical protein